MATSRALASPVHNPSPSSSRPTMTGDNDAFEMGEDCGAPPSYDEVINSTRFPVVRSGTRVSIGSGNGWKLDFVDFTPHLPSNPGNKQVGNFRSLLRRANTWLKNNTDIELVTCETITWYATTAAQLSETNIVHRTRSQTSSIKTKYLRGLRLWFIPQGVDGDVISVGMEDYLPDDNEENIENLVKRINRKLKDTPVPGRILTIETCWTRSKPGKVYANSTYWTEQMTKARRYAFFIRIFFVEGPPKMEKIGLKDFLPNQTTDSYENYSHVSEKANQWVAEQTDINVVNVQAVFVKKKKVPTATLR